MDVVVSAVSVVKRGKLGGDGGGGGGGLRPRTVSVSAVVGGGGGSGGSGSGRWKVEERIRGCCGREAG